MGQGDLAGTQKKARRLGAMLVFVDESGFSLIPNRGRTWAPRGQTPILRHRVNWPKLSAISAVMPNPHVYLQLVRGTIRSPQVVRFVRHLLQHIPGRIFLFWDGNNPHRSRFTREALTGYARRVSVYRLPPYAPELNPDEGLWAYLKGHALRGYCPPDVAALSVAIRQAVRHIRRRPHVIRSFFRACPLSF